MAKINEVFDNDGDPIPGEVIKLLGDCEERKKHLDKIKRLITAWRKKDEALKVEADNPPLHDIITSITYLW